MAMSPRLIQQAVREIVHHLATSPAVEPKGSQRCPWACKAYEVAEELYERLLREEAATRD